MAFEFDLPDIGEGLTEATIIEWKVAVGDTIGTDEPMVEIETDKAVVEIPAPRAGIILHLGAAAGTTIEVDSLLVVIGDEGEEWVAPSPEAPERVTGAAAPIVGTLHETAHVLGAAPRALPKVRRLAAELGVDLGGIAATGVGGTITEEDVRAAVAPAEGRGKVQRLKLSPTRRAIADNLSRSWREIPHVWTYGAANASAMLSERRRLAGEGTAVPLEALLIRAIVPLLRSHPEFNASVAGDELIVREYFDIGFAVDTPEGLMVAVIRDADALEVAELGNEITRLATAARDRTATPDELRGATFTVSNIGAVGGSYGTPIVPYGTTAILSVGRAEPTPVVRDGAIQVETQFPLSLAYDHRAIDGAAGRRFMSGVVAAIGSGAR